MTSVFLLSHFCPELFQRTQASLIIGDLQKGEWVPVLIVPAAICRDTDAVRTLASNKLSPVLFSDAIARGVSIFR